MKPDSARERAIRFAHRSLLRSASLLVPASQRTEWRCEWRGELWHVQQASALGLRGRLQAIAFCLGAFQDAFCLRRAAWKNERSLIAFNGTPSQCMLGLAAILVASYALALLLPGVRAERSLWPRKANPNLVLIQQHDSDNRDQPTISAAQYNSWQSRRQQFFKAMAFYRVIAEQQFMPNSPQSVHTWQVGHASPNLLSLLGLPIRFGDAGQSSADERPSLILSERVWKSEFGADPRVAGREVRLGDQNAKIIGVAPDGSLDLPGNVDAWQLDLATRPGDGAMGFVVAHLTDAGNSAMWTQDVNISSDSPDESEDELLGVALEEGMPAPRTIYLFAFLLALLSLPAITSVSLGESGINPHRTSWSKKIFRWGFFAAKIALLLPSLYFVSLDLAYGFTALGRERAIYIHLASTFALALFSLQWILKDQRQRCPVCNHRVTHPAHVGQASRTFLDWNGTEMMCMGGHTLLHVPSLPTSWFSTQRWLYLDTSWGFLFVGSTRPIP